MLTLDLSRAEKELDSDGKGSERQRFQNMRLINQVIQEAAQTLLIERCRARSFSLLERPLQQATASMQANSARGRSRSRRHAPLHKRESA